MEFPELGEHCSNKNCKRLDFLPIKCDACKKLFCSDHYKYTDHECENAHIKNNIVPVCPLCNSPIPIGPNQSADEVVGLHIDNNCKSDLLKRNTKKVSHSCSVKGCKIKEAIPVICNECTYNFCLKHRHPVDHKCVGSVASKRKRMYDAFATRRNNENFNSSNLIISTQGNLSEDEALAKALALSMQDSVSVDKKKQEELDLALARQLQASESQTTASSTRDRCNIS